MPKTLVQAILAAICAILAAVVEGGGVMLPGARMLFGGASCTYEVQYIGNTLGGGTLDTGLYGNDDLCVSIDIEKDDKDSNAAILGGTDVWTDTVHDYALFDSTYSENRTFIAVGQERWFDSYLQHCKYEQYRIAATAISWYGDGAQGRASPKTRSTMSGQTRSTMRLWGTWYSNKGASAILRGTYSAFRILGRVRFYSRATGLPVKTLVPYCKNGVPCFYDEVNNEWLYEESGSGFYCGPKGMYSPTAYAPGYLLDV